MKVFLLTDAFSKRKLFILYRSIDTSPELHDVRPDCYFLRRLSLALFRDHFHCFRPNEPYEYCFPVELPATENLRPRSCYLAITGLDSQS